MKVVFLGTAQFAIPFLDAVNCHPEHELVAVITQPDKPAGRGNKMRASAIKERAEQCDIKVFTPKSLKTDESETLLKDLAADVFVVVAYGKIIPQNILDLPKHGCLNVHPSLLPQYRGPSPMQWAIAEGDAKTGITIMLLDAGMDTGPILAQESLTLDSHETLESLVMKVWQRGPNLLIDTLDRYLAGDITPVAQDDSQSSLTSLLSREDGRINWEDSLNITERKVRAYDPWPGTWTMWTRQDKDFRLKILEAAPADFTSTDTPGTVTIKEDRLFVETVDGTLEVLKIQIEGKPAMEISSFLTGYSDINGTVLS